MEERKMDDLGNLLSRHAQKRV